jgi:hypothetical protein
VPRTALRAVLVAVIALAFVYAAVAWLGGRDRGPGVPATPTRAATATAATAPTGNPVSSGDRSSPSHVAVLVGAGDIADCSSDGDEATAELLGVLDGTVFTLGDNVYENGTPDEFERCYGPSWGRPSIRNRTRPTPGDHEYNTPNATGYYGYFGHAAGDPATGYYAYDHGTWRIYVLNSNCAAIGGCAAGSVQERWLRQDLATNPRLCIAAMWHEPRFSSGFHGSSAVTVDLWRALYDGNAELVLNGHDHHYERFAPQDPDGAADPDHGLVQFVVGTGGRFRRGVGPIEPNSVVTDTDTWGILRLSLADDSWTSEFIPVSGGTFTDRSSGTCH